MKSIDIDSTDITSYNIRASVYYMQSDYVNAIKDLIHVVECDSECAEAYAILGKIYLETGDSSLAKHNLMQAHECNPIFPASDEARAFIGIQ
jgi:Tfp pilus assembly protein PilF